MQALSYFGLVSVMLSVSAATPDTVVTWGDNRPRQTDVPAGLSNVVAIAAGTDHSVAIRRDGTVVAWGLNHFGQTAVPPGLGGVTAIAACLHTVALKDNGTVVAWGYNGDGQTTGTASTQHDVPAVANPVTLLGQVVTEIKAIAVGGQHTVAVKSNGTVVAWGRNSEQQITIPLGLTNVTSVAGGGNHTLALKDDGTVVAWGYNGQGQVTVPVGLTNVVGIAAGQYHSLALKNDGTVVAWGFNENGQTVVPTGLTGVTAIAASVIGRHNLALKQDGTVVAWGAGTTNSGSGADFGQSIIPPGLKDVTAIAAGGRHNLAISPVTLFGFGGLRFYAGTLLDGPVGHQFRVDYADVVNTGNTNWLVLTNLTLPYSPFLVIDPNSPNRTNRFYRAVPVP